MKRTGLDGKNWLGWEVLAWMRRTGLEGQFNTPLKLLRFLVQTWQSKMWKHQTLKLVDFWYIDKQYFLAIDHCLNLVAL